MGKSRKLDDRFPDFVFLLVSLLLLFFFSSPFFLFSSLFSFFSFLLSVLRASVVNTIF